jgi:hypothetical protein
MSLPVYAQYAGPAILSRGEAPAAMSGPNISFRPFVEFTGTYDTGLSGVVLKEGTSSDLANSSSYGMSLAAGVSGTHRWRHTTLGLDYRASVQHYAKTTYYDSTNQSLLLGISHQISRHVTLTLRESAGMFSRDSGLLGLPQTVPFDPSSANIPTTDFFDNRTIYLSSQADLIYQKSARLSFSAGGDTFLTRRRSSALYGVKGDTARGDVQYRISRRSTIGTSYNYTHFTFTGLFSGTDFHAVNATYSIRISRNFEISAYGGILRAETKFIQNVPVDPIITAILGITSSQAVQHNITRQPNLGGRISRTYRRGVAYVSGGNSMTPGNGLFLTSSVSNVSAGYTYTGLRRWSFSSDVTYNHAKSIGHNIGRYSDVSGTVSLSRQIQRTVHFVFGLDVRQYQSGNYQKYNRLVYGAHIGLGFSPGDVPLRVW